MKDFYTVPNTKEEFLSNIEEMNTIQKMKDHKIHAATWDIKRFGLTPKAQESYRNFVFAWVKAQAGIGKKAISVYQKIFAEMGWTIEVEWIGNFRIISMAPMPGSTAESTLLQAKDKFTNIAQEKGYKPGWVFHQIKELYGEKIAKVVCER